MRLGVTDAVPARAKALAFAAIELLLAGGAALLSGGAEGAAAAAAS